jgi:hypothetical protein
MTNTGILTLMLRLIGIRSRFAHHEIMEAVELCQAVGNSYRLASSEAGSTVMYFRLTFNFLKVIAEGMLSR